jgi:hypothetical protein
MRAPRVASYMITLADLPALSGWLESIEHPKLLMGVMMLI